MLLDTLYGLLPILAAMALAVLPLLIVLPAAPPLIDSPPPPGPCIGWRISLTIARAG